MTKNEYKKRASLLGYEAKYSGKLRRFFTKKVVDVGIHTKINLRNFAVTPGDNFKGV